MNNNIIDTLNKIETFCGSTLKNRIEENILTNMLQTFNVTNPEIAILYNWKDGSNFNFESETNIAFCSFGYVMSISESLKVLKEKTFLKFAKNELIPIVCDYFGDYLLISISEEEQPVYIYSPALSITEPVVIFSNISTFFLSILECYKEGVYRLKSSLLIDMDREDEIFKKNDMAYLLWSDNE